MTLPPLLRSLTVFVLLAACSAEAPASRAPAAGWSIDPGADQNAFFDCLAKEGIALVSAHRGGPAEGYPENAIETAERTLSLAPALVEVDVRASADGVLFLLHNETLERTTTGAGRADALPWAEIAALRLKGEDGRATAFRPPRFAEFLDWAKERTLVQVDIPRGTEIDAVIGEIRAAGAENRVILIARTLAEAEKAHRLAPEMRISLNLFSMSELNAAIAAGLPADRLIGFTGTREPSPRLYRILADRGVEVIFGTLGREDSIDAKIAAAGEAGRYAELAGAGVDVIATDRPLAAHADLVAAGRGAREGVCGVARR